MDHASFFSEATLTEIGVCRVRFVVSLGSLPNAPPQGAWEGVQRIV